MNEQALRDLERWKDKIEVRLDNRQVFFLFFGSALVACLLFVLGVIVGKRLESRGRAAAPEIDDPLALLDKMATSLTDRPADPVQGGVAVAAVKAPSSSRSLARNAASRIDLEAAQPAAVPEKAMKGDERSERANGPTVATAVREKERERHGEPAAAPAIAKTKPLPALAPVAAPAMDAKPKARFTLQIGAFPDQAEAQSFASRFGGAGKTYIVKAEVPEKGTWYKVRMGEFSSHKDATAAKAAFEKQHNSIALVAPK